MATYRLQRVASGVDEEKAAVNSGIGDMLVSEGSELLAEVGRVLIFDLRSVSLRHPRQDTLAGLTCLTIGSQQLSLLI